MDSMMNILPEHKLLISDVRQNGSGPGPADRSQRCREHNGPGVVVRVDLGRAERGGDDPQDRLAAWGQFSPAVDTTILEKSGQSPATWMRHSGASMSSHGRRRKDLQWDDRTGQT
jgi:hypothetical protein